jgi:MFS family permease
MADRRETGVVYAAGTVQGVALVTFPAASTIFTSPSYYGLSSTAYGAMFLPQAVTAIAASLLGARLTRGWGIKRVFLVGLIANFSAMLLLLLSQAVMSTTTFAYLVLLAATTCLGVGFGLTVPSLNTFVAAFSPAAVERAVLSLNALLGLGTVLAPAIVAIFVGLGAWSLLPLLVAVLLAALLLFSVGLPLEVATGAAQTRGGQSRTPGRFWVFAAFAALYGIVETMNGNWATLYMANDLGATTTVASLALTAFWGMVTVGRFGVWSGRAWLLGLAAADDWLRPGGAAGNRRVGRGVPDRVLPDGLRHRRFRSRPHRTPHRVGSAPDLRTGCVRRAGNGGTLICRGLPAPGESRGSSADWCFPGCVDPRAHLE